MNYQVENSNCSIKIGGCLLTHNFCGGAGGEVRTAEPLVIDVAGVSECHACASGSRDQHVRGLTASAVGRVWHKNCIIIKITNGNWAEEK